MSDFGPLTLAAIARELLGPLSWPAVAVLGAVLLVLAAALLMGQLARGDRGRTWRPAAIVGLAAGIAVAAMLPAWTLGEFAHFGGAVDYFAVVAAGIAAAIGVCLASLPFIAFLRR